MTVLDQIRKGVAELASQYGHNYKVAYQSVETYVENHMSHVYAFNTPLVTCKDCKHGHITTDGKCCKWCSIMAMHQIDSDEYVDPPNGYDPEPYFSADFFCGFAERRDA